MGCLWPSLESITWCHMFCLMMLLGDWVRLWETAFGSVYLPGCSVPLVAMSNRISFCCSTKEGHPSTCKHTKSLNSGRFFAILRGNFQMHEMKQQSLEVFFSRHVQQERWSSRSRQTSAATGAVQWWLWDVGAVPIVRWKKLLSLICRPGFWRATKGEYVIATKWKRRNGDSWHKSVHLFSVGSMVSWWLYRYPAFTILHITKKYCEVWTGRSPEGHLDSAWLSHLHRHRGPEILRWRISLNRFTRPKLSQKTTGKWWAMCSKPRV